jgi:DNA-binding XRE family transcriptional regulator
MTGATAIESEFARPHGVATWEEIRATLLVDYSDEELETRADCAYLKYQGHALGEVRAKSRFTKRKMAKKIGVSRHLICAFEKGEVADEDLIGAYQRILGEAGHTLPER